MIAPLHSCDVVRRSRIVSAGCMGSPFGTQGSRECIQNEDCIARRIRRRRSALSAKSVTRGESRSPFESLNTDVCISYRRHRNFAEPLGSEPHDLTEVRHLPSVHMVNLSLGTVHTRDDHHGVLSLILRRRVFPRRWVAPPRFCVAPSTVMSVLGARTRRALRTALASGSSRPDSLLYGPSTMWGPSALVAP